jgi:hopanoid-associated phosphorylase
VTRLGVVTGLAFEAACLRRALPNAAGLEVACVAGDYRRAYAAATELAEGGADLLVSFGFAGGLKPDLQAGEIVLADSVVGPAGQRLPADGDSAGRLADAAARDAVALDRGAILGVHDPVTLADDKIRLGRRNAAVAVDMESLGVAEAAAFKGRPFLCLRVIVDGAGRDVPPAAIAAMAPNGRLRPLAILGSLLRDPAQVLDLLRLARDAAIARRSLRRAALALGHAFVPA